MTSDATKKKFFFISLVYYAPVALEDLISLKSYVERWSLDSRLRPIFIEELNDCIAICNNWKKDESTRRFAKQKKVEGDVVQEFDSRKDELISFATQLLTLSISIGGF